MEIDKVDFSDTPLGNHAMRHRSKSNFIDKFNDFWVWQYSRELWNEMGRPDPFDDSDAIEKSKDHSHSIV